MVSWAEDGRVAGYGRAAGTGIYPTVSVFTTAIYKLASPGTVDLNGVTRFQYRVEDFTSFASGGTFRYTGADVAALPGRLLTATAFLAPASAFAPGVKPRPSEIISAAEQVVRAVGAAGPPNYRTTPGDFMFTIFSPAQAWEPNTKWWWLVAPTHIGSASDPPSIGNDIPIGDVDVNGRAVSMWTNRTPQAPVITTPAGQVTAFAGTEIDFAFSSRDPDRVATFPGDVGPTDFADLAGIQVQFSPVPTEAEPSPAWQDLPVASSSGGVVGPCWYIDRASAAPDDSGARGLWLTGRIKIRCGFSTVVPGTVPLPSGDWRIRMRTFDYGHPLPDGSRRLPAMPGYYWEPPLTDSTFSYTPSNYPAVNTSPWSEHLRIIVSPQVPPPIPLSPINSMAVIGENEPVTLSWQYRNTFSPPLAQARRTIQIRKVGGSWEPLLTDDESDDAFYEVPDYPFVSGNQYEWRVKVSDTSGVSSDFSISGFFWVVPEPDSGGVIPPVGDLLESATLGCGTHRIAIYRRGGLIPVGEIDSISSVEWNRVRDDISDAKIVVSGWSIDCGNLLAKLQSWAYEVVIYRDNGFSIDRVWEGPITLLTYEVDSVTIHAKDVMGYAYRRIIRQAMSDAKNGDTVTSRATRILLNAFAPDDPNVLPYLRTLTRDDDAKQYRSTPAYSRTAFEEIDDMAANAGLDYTAVGRSIIVWGTKHRIGTLPEFRDSDLGAYPIVSEYGMSMANRYAVSDGNGVYGVAERLDEFGQDPTYGLVEVLSSTWASDSPEDAGSYTQEGLATIRKSFAAAAERSIADKYPPPVVVRVPDNTRLNPDTVLSIQHLVPGVVIPLRSTRTLRTVVASQKLDAVKVVESAGEESITITLSPFSRDDGDIDPGPGGGPG